MDVLKSKLQFKRNGVIYTEDDFKNSSSSNSQLIYTEDEFLKSPSSNSQLIDTEDKILSKIQTDLINNGWNEFNENVLKAICKNSLEYKHLHEKYSYNYKLFNKILSIFLLIFTTGLSADTTFNISGNSHDIFTKIITYGTTLLTLILNFIKAEESSASHFTSSLLFAELYNNTLQQSCLTRSSRKNGVKYINEILEQYNNIISRSPTIKLTFIDELNSLKLINSGNSIEEVDNSLNKKDIVLNIDTTQQTKTNKKQIDTNLTIIQKCVNDSQDISDKDMLEMSSIQLNDLCNKITNVRLEYEKNRMLKHTLDSD
jgi:hypothetical protein